MFRIISLTYLAFLWSLCCLGMVASDSLVYFSEISYDSDLEKEVFNQYFADREKNYLDLFSLAGSNSDSTLCSKNKRDFNKVLQEIKNGSYSRTDKESKKIQIIYKTVHNQFLKKYQLENHFNEIFSKGYFNCVSGSALFALVFNELKIPYEIIETPDHVYLVSFPATSQIVVETTDPVKGYYSYDPNFKAAYVKHLKESKLISSEEYNSGNMNEIFDKYYFSQTRISLHELVGIQYCNDALYHINNKDYERAYKQLEKSYLFYPSERVAYLMVMSSAYILEKTDYSQADHILYTVKMSRFSKHGISNKDISNEFIRITRDVLIDRSEIDRYDILHEELSSGIKNDTLKKEIDFIYNYERGRILFNQGNFNPGISFVEKAYDLKPGNADAQSLFVAAISQKLKYSTDIAVIIQQFESYLEKYSDLAKNNLFCTMLCHSYLLLSSQNYSDNNISGGDKYRMIFEEFSAVTHVVLDGNIIGNAYSLASSAYFRKGNQAKTKFLLKKGLEYDPNNYELKRRLEMVK